MVESYNEIKKVLSLLNKDFDVYYGDDKTINNNDSISEGVNFNNEWEARPTEYRILGDSPAIGVLLFDGCGNYEMLPAPLINDDMSYGLNSSSRLIRVYKDIDARFILEDLYSKLELFNK